MNRCFLALVVAAAALPPVDGAAQGRAPDLASVWPAPPPWRENSGEAAADTVVGAWWAAAALGRLYGLPELPVNGLAIGREGAAKAFSVSWQRAGTDTLWREDVVSARWRSGRRRVLGLAVRVALSPGLPGGWTVALVAGRRGADWWCTTAWVVARGGATGTAPLLQAGVRRGRAVIGGSVWDTEAGPVGALAAWWRPAPAAALGVRLDPVGGEVGLLLALRRGTTSLRLAVLSHPVLGESRFWRVAWGRRRGW